MNVNVADRGLGAAGRIVTGHIQQTEDRLRGVPFLAQSRLGSLDGVARQLPIAVQPIRIPNHNHDPVLAIAGGKILGNFGGQVLGGNANIKLAAFDLLLGRGRAVRVAGNSALRLRPD